ncbi:hypothetical protein NE615_24940, partial [Escherichia coli]|nr:hypothetical protein [Escherichia coli]
TLAMILLAVPFTFSAPRSPGSGSVAPVFPTVQGGIRCWVARFPANNGCND